MKKKNDDRDTDIDKNRRGRIKKKGDTGERRITGRKV